MSYTSSAYWLRLELENNSDKPIERVLDVNHSLLEKLDFYFQTENQNYQPEKLDAVGNADVYMGIWAILDCAEYVLEN